MLKFLIWFNNKCGKWNNDLILLLNKLNYLVNEIFDKCRKYGNKLIIIMLDIGEYVIYCGKMCLIYVCIW